MSDDQSIGVAMARRCSTAALLRVLVERADADGDTDTTAAELAEVEFLREQASGPEAEKALDMLRDYGVSLLPRVVRELVARRTMARPAPVERTPEVGTSYTRAQFAAAVDEAHGALHEHGELTGPLWRAHEALHNVGAGQERVACATMDPEAQAIHADPRALREREIPCGHTVADLIGGTERGPDGRERPSITKCGACLAIRQPEILAARQAKAAERTPEVVLRAMLRAYEASALEAAVRYFRGEGPDDATVRLERATERIRTETAHVVARGSAVDFMRAHLQDDYEARLRGERPLDAPPMEVP